MSTFKIALTAIFAVCIVVGVAIFALQKAGSGAQSYNITVWGTLSRDAFDSAMKGSSINKSKTITVNYVQKDSTTFDTDFVQALADGKGPDVVILRDDAVYKERNRLFTIPYANYTERIFKDTFIQEGEMYMTPDGLLALPFIVDPLVMYWNRDLFNNNLIPEPPKYWDEFYGTGTSNLISKITHADSGATITQSALAFGEWSNVTNAKEILSTLMLQAGTPITERNSDGSVSSVVSDQFNYPIAPGEAAVNFYTQFANPTSPTYTWNRSLPDSLDFFLSGKLATYFGFASEILGIQQKNPNLNFDVTYVPQIRSQGTQTPKQAIFAHMYGLAIVKQSKQVAGAFAVITALTEPGSLSGMETVTNLPPVRRDLLAVKPTDPFRTVFYNSALLSYAWIDPDGTATSNIFGTMIESIDSGAARTSEALQRADTSLGLLLK